MLTCIKLLRFYQQPLKLFTFFIYTFPASSDELMTVNTLALDVIFPQVMCIWIALPWHGRYGLLSFNTAFSQRQLSLLTRMI